VIAAQSISQPTNPPAPGDPAGRPAGRGVGTGASSILATAQALRWETGNPAGRDASSFHEQLMEAIYAEAARIADRVVARPGEKSRFDLDRTIDRIVTSRVWSFPVMMLLLTVVFWITISGANVPSEMLSSLLIGKVYPALHQIAAGIGLPWWLSGVLIDGMYLATAWVVSVMLPPMAIFFPLFTLLEDFGYLPRVAFNLDSLFKKAGAHGKQALSMMMGFGCNAAGVVSTRIIDSPRERLIAILTNNFALCNGRWPTQILIATLFIGALAPAYPSASPLPSVGDFALRAGLAGLISALAVVGIAMLGVFLTFAVSWALSRTALRGEVSAFSLELPPYRPPRVLQTIYTSIIDRTLFVLWRALVFAVPAGAVIWLSANIHIGGVSIAEHLMNLLNPIGVLVGLNGVILVAYLFAIPANEIVIPTVLMLTVLACPRCVAEGVTGMSGVGASAGVMFKMGDADTLALLRAGGWTLLTGINLMLFSLIHNPCSTTLLTIYKETGSRKWAAVAALLPLALGFIVTFFVTQVWRLLGGAG